MNNDMVWFNFFVLLFYALFLLEMSVILANLTIGLTISNIQVFHWITFASASAIKLSFQNMRKNADTLRLVKEVRLLNYLESQSKLFKWPSFSQWKCHSHKPKRNSHPHVIFTDSRRFKLPSLSAFKGSKGIKIGQVVSEDLYNCYAAYSLQSINSNFEYGQIPKLVLMEKESPLESLRLKETAVPKEIIIKAKDLLKHRKGEDHVSDHFKKNSNDFKSMVLEMKSEVMASHQKTASEMNQLLERSVWRFKELLSMKKNHEKITDSNDQKLNELKISLEEMKTKDMETNLHLQKLQERITKIDQSVLELKEIILNSKDQPPVYHEVCR